MAFGARKAKKKNATPLLDAQRKAALNNIAGICESAFLAAAADGELSDAEMEVLVHTIVEFCNGDVTAEEVGEILEKCDNALAEDGFEARMGGIAGKLSTDEARGAALMVVAAVILCDDSYDPESEGAFYDDLAVQIGVAEEDAAEIWNSTLEQFGLA